MKCHNCQFILSDRNDICLKCSADLRPFKKTEGLPIVAPDAPYQSLLLQLGLPPAVEVKPLAEPKTGFFSKLKALFSKPAKPKKSAIIELDTPLEPELNTPLKKPNEELTAALPVAVEVDKPDTFPPEETQPVKESVNHEANLSTAATQAEAATPATPLQSIDLDASTEDEEDSGIAVEIETAREDLETIEQPLAAAQTETKKEAGDLRRAPPKPAFADNTIGAFDEVDYSLRYEEAALQAELSLRNLQPDYRSKETDILFDLAQESLLRPGSEKRYVERISVSTERKVEASFLARQLDRVQKVMEAPVLSLKNIGLSQNAGGPETQRRRKGIKYPELLLAPPRAYFACFAVDLGVILAASLLLGLVLTFWLDKVTLAHFYPLLQPTFLDILPFASYFLTCFVLLIVVYPLVGFWFFGGTVGSIWQKLVLVSDNGLNAEFSNVTVRVLLQPVSLLTGACIAIYYGKRPWHDLAARTVLGRAMP